VFVRSEGKHKQKVPAMGLFVFMDENRSMLIYLLPHGPTLHK
jgi:hypothetical protein